MFAIKTLLITGASSDIAATFINKYGNGFDKIICHYRSELNLARFSTCHSEIVSIQADLAKENLTEKLDLIPTHFLHLPSLPNINKQFPKTSWSECEAHLNVSAKSFYEISKAILPTMAKNKYGKIVAMLTINAALEVPAKYSIPYTAAKYYLLSLVKCLSAEYPNLNINAISPAYFETKFNENLPDIVKEINKSNSNLSVEEVAESINMLLSDDYALSGQNIVLDGR